MVGYRLSTGGKPIRRHEFISLFGSEAAARPFSARAQSLRVRAKSLRVKALVFGLAFATVAAAILTRPDNKLRDFDQSFYVTMAYDLDRHATLSNGIFVDIDSAVAEARPGMFFGPVYPVLVLAAMKIDSRFAEAVRCAVEADRKHRDENTCEPYARPVRILHALLLALGVLAIASAGQHLFASRAVFWLSGVLATVALAIEAPIFSFVMTESLTFSLYSIFALAMVLAWTSGRTRYFILTGGVLGVLCLTRLSFLAAFPLAVALSAICAYRRRPAAATSIMAMTTVFACMMLAWGVRNVLSVGKFGLSEEYGAAVLIERFAYNDMSAHEFLLAFPFCTPGLGELAFDTVYGTDSMHRFVFFTPGSFFNVGRDRRDQLVAEHGRLDPLIGHIVREEMRSNWWRHLLVSFPLAWCGMWAGWVVSLMLLPLFICACGRAIRQGRLLFVLYAAPPLAMLALHALIANHYTRYNLILIGPYAVGAAWILSVLFGRLQSHGLGDSLQLARSGEGDSKRRSRNCE